MPRVSDIDFTVIREGLASLPVTPDSRPGDPIRLDNIVVVPSHRAALDPDRTLVVGNRGVGKSYWTHVLANPEARTHVAKTFRELAAVDVDIGFDASERVSPVAPTPAAVNQAFHAIGDAEPMWRTILLRVAKDRGVTTPPSLPESFAQQAVWVRDNGEQVDRIVTALDDRYAAQGKKLVLVFDALDHLGPDWQTKRVQTTALLQRALAARSYRSIRLKLFMRRDQFEDPLLFRFADGSKISNPRVDLLWSASELYTLLFSWLANEKASASEFEQLQAACRASAKDASDKAQKKLVDAIAGEFMGATAKQGRVYTWLPLHLSDARGETSPRTFLTAWHEAAHHQPAPAKRAVDHRGIHEGVRRASAYRLKELSEDYWWISVALRPLRDQQVPMERPTLKRLWSEKKTAREILNGSSSESSPKRLAPVRLETVKAEGGNLEDALIDDLAAIGIIEVRPNDKINIPDIFRLEAGIKRKGGVPAPKRAQRE